MLTDSWKKTQEARLLLLEFSLVWRSTIDPARKKALKCAAYIYNTFSYYLIIIISKVKHRSDWAWCRIGASLHCIKTCPGTTSITHSIFIHLFMSISYIYIYTLFIHLCMPCFPFPTAHLIYLRTYFLTLLYGFPVFYLKDFYFLLSRAERFQRQLFPEGTIKTSLNLILLSAFPSLLCTHGRVLIPPQIP